MNGKKNSNDKGLQTDTNIKFSQWTEILCKKLHKYLISDSNLVLDQNPGYYFSCQLMA